MTEGSSSEGALRYKRDQRRRSLTFAAAMVIAAFAGLSLGYARDLAGDAGGLDATLAIVLALLFVAAMVAANWIYLRNADELTWANNVRASFWAFMIFVILYPVWLILWSGGLVREPSAETLYLVTIFSAGALYLWERFR